MIPLLTALVRINAEIERQRAAGRALLQLEGDLRAQPRITRPSTRRRTHATLQAALNDAVRKRQLTWNPCVGVELGPEEPAGPALDARRGGEVHRRHRGRPDGPDVQDRRAARGPA